MTKDDTELEGVSHLNIIVTRSPILRPFFQQNDKTPFFDGNIFVYEGAKDKENYENFIPVQIKSTKVDEFSLGTTSYALDIVDIRGYYNSRGIILFVVEICGTDHKVFIKSLLPSELKDVLAELEKRKSNEPRKTFYLDELDTSTPKHLEYICKDFLMHRKLQYSTIEYSLSINDASEIKIPFLFDDRPLEEQIFSKEHLLYGKRSNETLLHYIETGKITSIGQSLNKSIVVNSKTYFSQYSDYLLPNGRFFEFGEKIRIDFSNNDTAEISYQLTGNLSEVIKVLSFLLDMFTIGSINIGDGKLEIKETKNKESFINEVQDKLYYYKNVETLFHFFDIDPDRLNLSLLENKDIAHLEFLLDLIIRNKKRETTPIQPGFAPIKIGNIILGVFIYKKEDDTNYTFIHLFRKLDNLKFRVKKKTENGDEIDFAVSLYMFLKHKFLVQVDNLDLEAILEDIKSITFSTEYGKGLNDLGLELIKAFDVSNRGEFLDSALDIFRWLLEIETNDPISKINELQIIRRKRIYTKNEKKLLIEQRIGNKDNNVMLCAINILLENKSEAETNFDEFTEKEKEDFIQYPIFTLAKQLNIFTNV